jgi:hypothetical protein
LDGRFDLFLETVIEVVMYLLDKLVVVQRVKVKIAVIGHSRTFALACCSTGWQRSSAAHPNLSLRTGDKLPARSKFRNRRNGFQGLEAVPPRHPVSGQRQAFRANAPLPQDRWPALIHAEEEFM